MNRIKKFYQLAPALFVCMAFVPATMSAANLSIDLVPGSTLYNPDSNFNDGFTISGPIFNGGWTANTTASGSATLDVLIGSTVIDKILFSWGVLGNGGETITVTETPGGAVAAGDKTIQATGSSVGVTGLLLGSNPAPSNITLEVTAPTPEPGTVALFGAGLAGLAIATRKRRKA